MPSSVSIQSSLSAGELSPSLYGRVDFQKYHEGTTTCRNFFSNYRGGVSSRAGLAYVGMCKQQYPAAPPRDIPFQFSISQGFALEFGDQYMRIKSNGAYVTENNINVSSVSSVGLFTTSSAHGYSPGDWIFDTSNIGFSGLTWIVNTTPSGTTFTVTDLFGTVISSASASGAGTVSRLYTVVAPYAAVDLPYLKYTQSADTMSLTCVNQATNTAYSPYDLVRHGNTNWTFTQDTFSAQIQAPTGLTSSATSSTTVNTWYSYVVTAVSGTGEESVASSPTAIENNDISVNEGSNILAWTSTPGAAYYNVYGATPGYSTVVPASASFGFLGRAFGPSFIDTNIVPDFTQSPPTHNNPFASGGIVSVTITAGGSGYSQSTVTFSVTTTTGSGFNGIPVVTGGVVTGFIVTNTGSGYVLGDTITISTGGTGATATLVIGPASGTFPSVVAYYQSRRVYANTLENPDTYFMSKPGLYNNFDVAVPTSASDAIIGTPWAQQVNGIQFLVPMPGGLVVLTGKGAWQVNGGSQAAITPATQTAAPQAYNGCNSRVPPIPINYDILYVQSKGSIVRDLSYNFFVNIYTGTDLTVLSNHLFTNHQIQQWAWAEEPYKLVWVVREDGVLLCLTYLKEQEVYAWTRHDTNGLFLGVSSITEPVNPNLSVFTPDLFDAVYVITQRFVRGNWRYYSERMDARVWNDAEDAYCVDAGLVYPQTFPNTTITASSPSGVVVFNTESSVFSMSSVGQIIRMGGGIAIVTQYNSGTQVIGTLTQTITDTLTDDPGNTPVPQAVGQWSITPQTSLVSGLNHLEGLTVTGLADGSVIPPQVVANGTVTLQEPASNIVIGLPYTCQVQTMYMDHPTAGGATIQTRRKNISAVGVRVEATRGLQVGADQPDQAALQNYPTPTWSNMSEIKERSPGTFAGNETPLYTGDWYKAITSGWDVRGQIALQQNYPLPANVLAVVAYWDSGDDH